MPTSIESPKYYATCVICGEEWRVAKCDADDTEYTCDYCIESDNGDYDCTEVGPND